MLDTDSDLIENASRVIAVESDALRYLSENLPQDLVPAIRKTLASSGRVIVSGIGKSGHIGRKIAATLASTGTPAFFIHTTEASHGDLGMIGKDDICLLISNSGETTELRDLVYHVERFSIPMIAISSNEDSTLMRAADYKLTLPKWPEACSIGMAPTTSTTLTLAIGDAFAIALMDSRSFKAEDFSVFHPGGKLGAQMRTVSDLMHTGDALPLIEASASMEDTLLCMTSTGFGIAALVEDRVLFGVITDGDLRRNMVSLMEQRPANICNTSPTTVSPDKLAAEALALMYERKVTTLLAVTDAKEVIGILNMHDFLRAGVV